jgi:recombination protein RecR
MNLSSPSLEKLIAELAKLPGIGRKSAQRLAFYLLKQPQEEVENLARALIEVKQKTRTCSVCFNLTEGDPCPICRDEQRDRQTLCVVEEAHDIFAIEKLGQYRGLYHVLGGVLSPLDGVDPEHLHIRELVERCRQNVKEVIIATSPSAEGDVTALYLAKLLRPLGVKVTRIARGIPTGSDLEYVDEMTLLRALEGRSTLE